jgi:rhodanese-related sulfurtransferase
MKSIQPTELHRILDQDKSTPLLDVRTPAEHARVHVPGTTLIPVDRLDAAALESRGTFSKNKPLFILCHSGTRAKQAAEKLERAGYGECCVVEGGTAAWEAAGLPVNRGASKVWPLDRQVRLVIGLGVVAGVLLGQFVNPAFIWLSAFMGAGLIFAAITDWCGLAIAMSKMPWNQRISGTSCSTN